MVLTDGMPTMNLVLFQGFCLVVRIVKYSLDLLNKESFLVLLLCGGCSPPSFPVFSPSLVFCQCVLLSVASGFPLTCLITSPPLSHLPINLCCIKDRFNLPESARSFSRPCGNKATANSLLICEKYLFLVDLCLIVISLCSWNNPPCHSHAPVLSPHLHYWTPATASPAPFWKPHHCISTCTETSLCEFNQLFKPDSASRSCLHFGRTPLGPLPFS